MMVRALLGSLQNLQNLPRICTWHAKPYLTPAIKSLVHEYLTLYQAYLMPDRFEPILRACLKIAMFRARYWWDKIRDQGWPGRLPWCRCSGRLGCTWCCANPCGVPFIL